MKLTKISALCLAATSLFAASSAMAWESENGVHSTSASVALSTDYMWRGYSQTDDKPALSGSFDYAHASGFYFGAWGSNVDFATSDDGSSDDATLELDVYAGVSNEFGDSGIGYDIGFLRYIYPGTKGVTDWNEVYGSLSYSYFSVGIAHSGNVYNSGEDGTYYTLGFDYDLPAGFALSAGVGYYDYDKNVYTDPVTGLSLGDSATDYRIGVSKEFAGFGFDLTYVDTNGKAEDLYGSDATDSRFVFTISKSL